MGPEFKEWPATPRLFRDSVITEKLDGENACVIIQPGDLSDEAENWIAWVKTSYGDVVKLGAQSRNRVITPLLDNAGFAAWVDANALNLAELLGVGYHYGEWWGAGIKRGYGLPAGDRRFSLFNVARWGHDALSPVPGLGVVPMLYRGQFNTDVVRGVTQLLAETGSQAAPGFMRPEGVTVYHSALRGVFKALIEADDQPKGAQA